MAKFDYIKKIVKACPRASFQNPHFSEDVDGGVIVRLGSPSDACRVIDALRRNGYDCNLASVHDGKAVRVNL